jgi:cell division protein FtsN
MSRDYANRKPSMRQTRNTRSGGGMPGWLWALAGLSLGLVVAAVVYIRRPIEKSPAQVAAVTAPEPKKPIAVPPKETPRFSFYEMLPSYEVVIPGNTKSGKKDAAPAIAGPGEYIIQVGSFKSRGEADAQKAKLALLGVEARVEQVTIDNKDTWFRVRIGPEKDQAKVEQLVARLAENSIDSYLMKVKKP